VLLPLELSLASAIGRELAHAYGGDLASTDGSHLGRLAGFTNQKFSRRQRNGYAPCVRVVYAQLGWATRGAALVEAAAQRATAAPEPLMVPGWLSAVCTMEPVAPAHYCAEAQQIYRAWLHRLHILQRFPHPDWSIADKWIAKELLRQGASVAAVTVLLREGSPGFPRGHGNPEDYLRRTLVRALGELCGPAFPALPAPCV
jgi:hypothetical protein